MPGRPALTMAWWEKSRATCVSARASKCVFGEGSCGWGLSGVEVGSNTGKTGGGDISGGNADKCGRLAKAYLVRGVVPSCFIC